MHTNPDHVM